VVTVNNDLTMTDRLFYIGSDYRTAGRTAAGMLSMMRYQKPLNIMIATGSLNIKGHNDRISGFTQALKRRRIDFTVKEVWESLDDDERAYQEAIRCLQARPEINCIYIAGAGVAGIGRAVRELGRKNDILTITFDDIATTRELMADGVVDFTICQEPHKQSYTAVQTLFEYFLSGKAERPKDFLTDTVIRIRENL